MSELLNIQEERELIYLLLHHKDAIDRFYDAGLSPDQFSEENRPILLSIIDSYDKNGVLLTRKSFKEKLKLNTVPKERISQELAFNSCYAASSDIEDLPMLMNKVIDRNIDNSITSVLEKFVKSRKKVGNVPAIKSLVNDCDDILSGAKVTDEKSYYEDIRVLSEVQVKYLEDVRSGKIKEDPIILSGIREMDYTMVTGFEKGTLTLICADVGGFKSAMMLNVGLNVWSQGFDVLFVPLEMHRDQMWRRACAREARIRSELITRNIKDLTDDQMQQIRDMNKVWNDIPAKFYMMQEPGNTTVLKIQRQIERNIELIRPKLVVIDYVANLEAHKNRYGRNDLEIGDMLKTMRQMGKDLDFAVLSAAQLGREALKRVRKASGDRDKTSINSEDIRGSHEYAADADNIFAQLKNVSQPSSLLDIFCVKSRNGPTVFENGKVRATLDIHPEYGLICSSPYNKTSDDPGENDENEKITADTNALMDQIEKDGVVMNKAFEEPDNLYEPNYDDYNCEDSSDDNTDIEKSINDGESGDDFEFD
jgi:replicative DNA helicase